MHSQATAQRVALMQQLEVGGGRGAGAGACRDIVPSGKVEYSGLVKGFSDGRPPAGGGPYARARVGLCTGAYGGGDNRNE